MSPQRYGASPELSDLAVQRLSPGIARILTDEVKRDAESLWRKLVELYEGGAHLALKYSSWGEYFAAEFGQSGRRGYQLLDAGRALEAVNHGSLGASPNERQARELAPLLDQPETLKEAWAEVVELHPAPTARDVRDVVQRKMDVHYSSATDDWSTPQDIFDALDAEFHFTVDVCASAGNAKCHDFYTVADDGLAQEWKGVCWMNPPYGDGIGKWIAKAYESSLAGTAVVCLVPGRIDTAWFWDYCLKGEVRLIRGRLKFGGGDTSAPFPSIVVVFPREPRVYGWAR